MGAPGSRPSMNSGRRKLVEGGNPSAPAPSDHLRRRSRCVQPDGRVPARPASPLRARRCRGPGPLCPRPGVHLRPGGCEGAPRGPRHAAPQGVLLPAQGRPPAPARSGRPGVHRGRRSRPRDALLQRSLLRDGRGADGRGDRQEERPVLRHVQQPHPWPDALVAWRLGCLRPEIFPFVEDQGPLQSPAFRRALLRTRFRVVAIGGLETTLIRRGDARDSWH